METLIWIGSGISVLGLVGVLASAVLILRAKRQANDDADLRSRLGRILPVNLGALFLGVLGLMTVAVAIMLG